MGYLGRVLEIHLAGAALRRFGVRVLRLVWPGDVLTCRGVVVDKREQDGECMLDIDVWADNQRGETVAKGRVLAVVAREAGQGLPQDVVGVVYRGAVSDKKRRRGAR